MSNQPPKDAPAFDPRLSSVRFNAMSFTHRTRAMSAAEICRLMDRACKAWMNGDASLFLAMPWIDGVTYRREHKNFPRHIPREVRQRVLSIGYCVQCGRTDSPSVDHIKPLAKGGTHDEQNLQRLCRRCNSSKGARWSE